jgi:VWFA-related protein
MRSSTTRGYTKITMKRIVPACLALAIALAQDPTAPQSQPPDTVIRINVNLVQVDAVVTDSKGNAVTGLGAQDFEILQDGKAQAITNFSYINLAAGVARATAVKPAPRAKGALPAPPPPPMALKPSEVRRTVALVVDDLGLAFASIAYVHDALKKFVDKEMQPGDLVAIVRTGAGMGALQTFTSDKRMLYAAIERVKFNSYGRVGISSFEALGSEPDLGEDANAGLAAAEEERKEMISVGTLGAIRYIIDGLRELPGRKSVVLFSENLRLFHADGSTGRTIDAVRVLTDAANRASVVIYSIDPRGLQTHSLTAADNTRGMTPQQVGAVPQQRSQQEFESQDGMAVLAKDTGGLFLRNQNDVGAALHQVLEDGAGYYLIGYHPQANTFDAKTGEPKFHSVRVRVKRPGLQVRSRSGFLGTSDREARPTPRTPRDQLLHALSAPFNSGAIHVRLTTLFSNGAKLGSFVKAMLFIDAKDLKFSDEPDGWHKASLDVVAVTFGDNGQAIDSTGRTFTIRAKDKGYQEMLHGGLVYRIHHAVKKPGGYQMRIALRDSASGEVGSATQFVEVPDVSKGRLTLSSIVIAKAPGELSKPVADDQAEGQVQDQDPNATPAVRIFQPGTAIAYVYQVLNAQPDPQNHPALQVQTRLFLDGKQVYLGKPAAFNVAGQPDPKRLVGTGSMRLGEKIAPGDYVLQVIVTDKLAKEKFRVAAQSMDFEIGGAQ